MLDEYDYSKWYKVDVDDLSSSEDDEEEVKKGKGLKILIPNKLLARIPVSLAQIKARNNSNKLKNEIRKRLYILYQHNKIIKKVYKSLLKAL